jgi:penicillin-binding protein 1A
VIKWLVVLPLSLMLVGALVAWVGWELLSAHYGKEAERFNLSLMENMESASIIYDREGKEMGKIFIQNRNPVPWQKISPIMVEAVIAAEDNRFYKHGGVDWAGIIRAAITNYRKGKISQGASTVTQQLARNSFEMRERTYQRKLLEIFLAQRIESKFSKQDIMRLYLNRVYFGSGLYGVEAAARGYFNKSAADLGPGEAAMLAGLLKSPQALSPWNNLESATQARNFVLKRMREQGFLKREQLKKETEQPLHVAKRTNPFKVSYAIDAIRQQAIASLGFDRAMNGGFQIHTTLDSSVQKAAEAAVKETLAKIEAMPGYQHETFEAFRKRVSSIEAELNRGNMNVKMPQPKYLQAAVLALDSSTGGILAMVGGRDFKHSEYNRATQARRPVGTAFAPFVFAAAYEKGAFPGDLVEDACIDNRYVMVGGESGILGEWGVERPDNEYEGNIPFREALAKGKNAATVRVGMQAGLDTVKKVAADSGIASPIRSFSNSFLGSSEITLDELTLGYTVFGNGGLRPEKPFLINHISDAAGHVVYRANPVKVPAISREAAYQVHSGLEDALHRGTGTISASYGLGDYPSAGKTGTAYNFTDTYFLGYNSSVTCGVWVGFDKPTRIFRGAFGKDLALPIWTRIMNTAAQEFPAVKFVRPETLKEVEICRSSGLLATPRCKMEAMDRSTGQSGEISTTSKEYVTDAQLPRIPCDVHGTGIRTYTKEFAEGDWPRAEAAIDFSRVRPVAVNSPTLIGLTDVYGAVRPGGQGFDESIPVAKAVAVDSEPQENGSIPTGDPAKAPPPLTLPDQTAVPTEIGRPGEDGLPVRRAEAADPGTSTFDAPAIPAPTPPPIRF